MSCSKLCPILVLILVAFSGYYLYTSLNPKIIVDDKNTVPQTAIIPDLIEIYSPRPETTHSSPIQLSGEARGYWFFEATAPVVVVNWDGLIIGEGYVTATEPWMTEDFVPFTGEITFTKPEYKDNGAIIFKNANASGLPEHDKALEFKIFFE